MKGGIYAVKNHIKRVKTTENLVESAYLVVDMRRVVCLILAVTILLQCGGWLGIMHVQYRILHASTKQGLKNVRVGWEHMVLSKKSFEECSESDDEMVLNHRRYDIRILHASKDFVELDALPDDDEDCFLKKLEEWACGSESDILSPDLTKTVCFIGFAPPTNFIHLMVFKCGYVWGGYDRVHYSRFSIDAVSPPPEMV